MRWEYEIEGLIFKGHGTRVWLVDENGHWEEMRQLKSYANYNKATELRAMARQIKLERSQKTSSSKKR